MALTKTELAERMAELAKLTPEEREAKREALFEPKRAEHKSLLEQAELAKLVALEEYGPGRVALLEDKTGYGGAIVLHTPEPHDFARARSVFRSENAKPAAKHDAEAALIRSCLVWPSLEAWEAALKRSPSWHNPAALKCWTLGELVEADTEEK